MRGFFKLVCVADGRVCYKQTILCYVGNFLVRMLTELNGGEEKTSVHVRTHMLPYLAGPQVPDKDYHKSFVAVYS